MITHKLKLLHRSCYSIEPLGLKWSREIPTRIGNACFCADTQQIFVSNLIDGVDQYDYPSLIRQKTFKHAIVRNYILQVVVAGEGAWLIAGGDSGFGRLFDRCNGELMTQLDYSDCMVRV